MIAIEGIPADNLRKLEIVLDGSAASEAFPIDGCYRRRKRRSRLRHVTQRLEPHALLAARLGDSSVSLLPQRSNGGRPLRTHFECRIKGLRDVHPLTGFNRGNQGRHRVERRPTVAAEKFPSSKSERRARTM